MGFYDEFANKIIEKKLDLVIIEFFEEGEFEGVHFGILVKLQIGLKRKRHFAEIILVLILFQTVQLGLPLEGELSLYGQGHKKFVNFILLLWRFFEDEVIGFLLVLFLDVFLEGELVARHVGPGFVEVRQVFFFSHAQHAYQYQLYTPY